MSECEEKLRSVHSAGTRDWISWVASHQKRHTCEACRGVEKSRQLLHYMTKVLGWPDS